MSSVLIKRNMRLFGLPYQFLPEVDPRIPVISKTVGRRFAENIILDAPVITIIPGKPKYLPTVTNKEDKHTIATIATSLLSNASDDFSVFKKAIKEGATKNNEFKYYDFERDYSEYIKYVNILCRTCATFLEINETIDGESYQRYDYRNYKWSTESALGNTSTEKLINSLRPNSASWRRYLNENSIDKKTINVSMSNVNATAKNTMTEMLYETVNDGDESDVTINDLLTSHNYVQFFIDSDINANENMSNTTSESQLVSKIFNTSEDFIKELAFLTNSGGIDTAGAQEFLGSTAQALTDSVSQVTNMNGIASRLVNLGGSVIKGENIIVPNIYQRSSYDKSYSFTVHLKTPYGTKFGYFTDICIPLMHLLALAIPKQATANTYGSPFLVKAYCEGLFTCNLGIVSSLSITKGVNNAFSVDGYPTEVDVTLTIDDLYTDLSMSPSGMGNIALFLSNSSLVEYLATTCGLSLVAPNLDKRLELISNTVISSIEDVPATIMSKITEELDKAAVNFLNLILP